MSYDVSKFIEWLIKDVKQTLRFKRTTVITSEKIKGAIQTKSSLVINWNYKEISEFLMSMKPFDDKELKWKLDKLFYDLSEEEHKQIDI